MIMIVKMYNCQDEDDYDMNNYQDDCRIVTSKMIMIVKMNNCQDEDCHL